MRYDVMIIGGGPGGYTAANKAAKNGLKTALFEKSEVGGTCLNRGCIPMKSLIESARIYKSHLESELFGIKYENVSFDYESVNSRRNTVVKTLREGVEKSLKANKVDLIKGEAKLISENCVECNGETYEADNIVIASGSIVSKPPIEGIELAISSDEVLESEYQLPESLVIIGGGVIGVEIASALSTFGTKVSVIEMADNLIPTMDKDIGQRLAMFFKKRGIEVFCSASVKAIKEDGDNKTVLYTNKNNEEVSISAKEVLIATGRKANIANLVKEGVDLNIDRGIIADNNGRTNIDNIYVIGDAMAGNIQLAHVAEAQGENVVDLILNKPQTNDMSVIPSGIYTDPEIASVGLREEDLKKQNKEYSIKKYLTGANGKCLIENSESGFVKLLVCDEVIVGGQIICPHATELIGELAIAVEKKMTLNEFAKVVHPHPTISEMMWGASKE